MIDQVEKTRKALDDAGSDAPMWATRDRLGLEPEERQRPLEDAGGAGGPAQHQLRRAQRLTDDLGLDGVVWYTWHDSTENAVGACGWCATAGLVDADRDSKPAWIAFTDLTGGTP